MSYLIFNEIIGHLNRTILIVHDNYFVLRFFFLHIKNIIPIQIYVNCLKKTFVHVVFVTLICTQELSCLLSKGYIVYLVIESS